MEKQFLTTAVLIAWVLYPSLWLLPLTGLWLWVCVHEGRTKRSQ